MPNLKSFESRDAFNEYYRNYNAKNKDKIRPYKREWMRNYRKKQKEDLQKNKKVR